MQHWSQHSQARIDERHTVVLCKGRDDDIIPLPHGIIMVWYRHHHHVTWSGLCIYISVEMLEFCVLCVVEWQARQHWSLHQQAGVGQWSRVSTSHWHCIWVISSQAVPRRSCQEQTQSATKSVSFFHYSVISVSVWLASPATQKWLLLLCSCKFSNSGRKRAKNVASLARES